LHKGLGR